MTNSLRVNIRWDRSLRHGLSFGFRRIALCLLLALLSVVEASGTARAETASPQVAEWTTSTLEDKIRGAWAGKMIGVVVGTLLEFRACGRIYDGPLPWDLPTTIALLQDDLFVNMAFLRVAEERGLDASQQQFAEAFRDTGFALFHANLAARRNLLLGLSPPLTGSPPYNLHAEDLDFQIESDFIGLISPGLPRAASDLALRIGPIMNYGNGVYGGVFVANLYSWAYVESDPRRVVEKAVRALPPDCAYRGCIETVLEQHAKDPLNWRAAWNAVQREWDGRDRCPSGMGTPYNIDAMINGAYVAIGLLYGEKDPRKTVEIAARCGQDADCNPSTAAGVLGAILGWSNLPEDWRHKVEAISDRTFSNVPYTFDSVSRATMAMAIDSVRRNGGTIQGNRLRVDLQPAVPPRETEQWDDGLIPGTRVPYASPKWKWSGKWIQATARGSHFVVARDPGADAEVEFDGEGVELIGCLIEAGGRLEVRLDDQPPVVVETYLFARDDMPLAYPEEALWFSGRIAPGHHVLRVCLLEEKHPRSKGRYAGLQAIVVFSSNAATAGN